jgi:leucyl aminopeptidase (aminopeptidase T)
VKSEKIDAYDMAHQLIGNNLGVKPNEEVFLVVDHKTDMTMPMALAKAALAHGAEYTIGIMPDRIDGAKATTCPNIIIRGAQGADVYFAMTRSSGASVYDGRVIDRVKQGKLRLCSMVMRDLENFTQGGALADYEKLDKEGRALAHFWAEKSRIEITSAKGTHLTAALGQCAPIVECGLARVPGQHMAFSDGEVSLAPNENTITGTLVIDGPICQLGMPKSPINMQIENGRVISATGEDTRIVNELRQVITEISNGDNIAEIGIGLNPASLFNGDFEEEKKARGTCHIALGDNLVFGGTVKCDVHLDMVMYAPTITMDGRKVVEDGRIVMNFSV